MSINVIVFVGDKPSKKNKDPNIPFVGTQSYKVLLQWIWQMDVDITHVILANKHQIETWNLDSTDHNTNNKTYIALGNKAAEELDKFNLSYYKLPHPSPKNRKLNNKKFIDSELEKCHDYIKGIK